MLDFLRDLHDDPQPSFVVKMVLAVSLRSLLPYPSAELTIPPATGSKCTRAHMPVRSGPNRWGVTAE